MQTITSWDQVVLYISLIACVLYALHRMRTIYHLFFGGQGCRGCSKSCGGNLSPI